MDKTISLLALTIAVMTSSLVFGDSNAGVPGKQPVDAFCGVGDHLWNHAVEPVDSPATVNAMFEWMAKTYKVKRMYWREERIWDNGFQIGKYKLNAYDWSENWKRPLYGKHRIHETAVEAAHKNGMEIFFYFGLFEHGVQPDVGVICPYQFEDELRVNNPQWCELDRWGQRRSPGPLSFCYPEVRKILVDRYVKHIVENDYDGVNFYTYVENLGLRYLHEFGFEQPILDEFNKKYSDIDLRKDTLSLTKEQKEHWYYCRGLFVTQFLRELHAGLAPHGKKISMILDAKAPDYVQPWWGHDFPGTGMIHLDWQTWIDEQLVDEFWVQLGPEKDQMKTMDLLIEKCKDTPVKLTLRTPSPFDKKWAPYIDAGVTPIAVITWTRNGIERLSLDPTSINTLKSSDWKLRVQTLDDIAKGKLKADVEAVAPLAHDPQVLVRRKAMYALAALADPDGVSVLEESLTDPESSVRIAAACALNKVNADQTPQRIIEALEKNSGFQFKMLCIKSLGVMKERSLPALINGLNHPNPNIREVCIRSLYKLGKPGGLVNQVYHPLRKTMLNTKEEYQNRSWAVDKLVGLRLEMNAEQKEQLTADLNRLLQESNILDTTQLHSAEGLGHMSNIISPEQKKITLDNLQKLFASYGDNCSRKDAAYGWRVVGNAMLRFGKPGKDILEAARTQTEDKWLAWNAYEVVYLTQKIGPDFCLIKEKEAIENQKKYAPPFPGWRKW
jgi:HEAT repeats/HEAT repeat